MKKRPTLADIAEAAGVSLMTVSRAINHKPGVSEDLRQNLVNLAEEMGYLPNHIARGLATHHTATIGLVVPDNTDPYFAQIARGVMDGAYENGYNIFLLNSNGEPAREGAALDSLLQKGIDGVILCSSCLPVESLFGQIQRFPAAVLLNRELKGSQASVTTLNVNDQRGSQLVVNLFLEIGRRNIAYLGGPDSSPAHQRRLEGYRASLKSAGMAFDPQMVQSGLPTPEGGRIGAAALLSRRPNVNAMYAFNVLAAVGALQACLEAGKRVPEEVAVVAADDIPLATIIRPQLTALHTNLIHTGCLALYNLLDMVVGGASPSAIQIEPTLYLRESAGVAVH